MLVAKMWPHVPPPGNTWHHSTPGVATHLKTGVLGTPVNGWLDPMKEAPSVEGLFLFQRHPHQERHRGRGTGDAGGVSSA